METTKQKNELLFCLEAVGCLLIVFIHCSSYPGVAGDFVNLAGHLPVPLFYAVSGFYLYAPEDAPARKKARLAGKVRHIFRLTVVSTVLYLAYQFASRRLLEGASFKGMLMEYFNPRELVMLLVFDRVTFAPHLWFVYGLFTVYLVLYALTCSGSRWADWILRSRWFPFALAVGGMVLRFAAFFSSWEISYFSVADVAFYRNWLFMGLPFVLMGQVLRAGASRIRDCSDGVLWGITLGGILLMIGEWQLYLKVHATYPEVYIGSILIVAGLFGLALKHPVWGKNTVVARFGAACSMPVYILHLMAFWLLNSVYVAAGGDRQAPWYFWGKPLLSFVLSALLSAVYLGLTRALARGNEK